MEVFFWNDLRWSVTARILNEVVNNFNVPTWNFAHTQNECQSYDGPSQMYGGVMETHDSLGFSVLLGI